MVCLGSTVEWWPTAIRVTRVLAMGRWNKPPNRRRVSVNFTALLAQVENVTPHNPAKAKGWPSTGMDEGTKGVLLVAASILAARKLAQWNGGRRFRRQQQQLRTRSMGRETNEMI